MHFSFVAQSTSNVHAVPIHTPAFEKHRRVLPLQTSPFVQSVLNVQATPSAVQSSLAPPEQLDAHSSGEQMLADLPMQVRQVSEYVLHWPAHCEAMGQLAEVTFAQRSVQVGAAVLVPPSLVGPPELAPPLEEEELLSEPQAKRRAEMMTNEKEPWFMSSNIECGAGRLPIDLRPSEVLTHCAWSW